MKTLIWVLVLAGAAPAFAGKKRGTCNYLLAPPPDVRVHRIEFPTLTPEVSGDERAEILRFVERHGLDVVEDGQGHLTGMAFDNRDGKKDRGYLLDGRIDGERFLVDQIWITKKSYNHFKRLAQARGLAALDVSLGRSLLKCPSLEVSGAVQVKLPMKHGLDLDDVLDFIVDSRAHPRWEKSKDRRKSFYKITDYDERGRLIEVVIASDGHCPNELLTAYEVH